MSSAHKSTKDTAAGKCLLDFRQIQLLPVPVPTWPKLAWVAECEPGINVRLYHGKAVEIAPQWAAEAVWCGNFTAGDFDRTDRVFGTGVRIRGNKVVFVTSCSALDRLWYRQTAARLYVSNSLPALCACAKISLNEGQNYDRHIGTVWGAPTCTRKVPVASGEIGVAWVNNLVYDGKGIEETVKPDTAPVFQCFLDYYEFLLASARGLGENMHSPDRRCQVTPFATLSSGYDSPAAALIGIQAGCKHAVTIEDANSLWRGSDSGAAIGRCLGLNCRTYRRTANVYPHETTVWAASGRAGLLSWTLFDYPEPVSALFTGCYGDAIWTRKLLSEPFTESILIDLGMGEFRLHVGMLQCVVPFLGMRHVREINAISLSDEMSPWAMHTGYDRPIPRRMLEESGVPRGAFAVRKKDTSHESSFRWPYSHDARKSLASYLKKRGLFAPSDTMLNGIHRIAHLDNLFYHNVTKRFGIKKGSRPWDKLTEQAIVFHWANEKIKQHYLEGIRVRDTAIPLPPGADHP